MRTCSFRPTKSRRKPSGRWRCSPPRRSSISSSSSAVACSPTAPSAGWRPAAKARCTEAPMNYRWDFASVFANPDALLAGLSGTLRLFAICLVAGLSLGLLVGLGRYSQRKWLYVPVSIFVEFFRNTPVLVQILWFYFALPILVPFEVSPLLAAALGISLNSAAFSAEIFRGG